MRKKGPKHFTKRFGRLYIVYYCTVTSINWKHKVVTNLLVIFPLQSQNRICTSSACKAIILWDLKYSRPLSHTRAQIDI